MYTDRDREIERLSKVYRTAVQAVYAEPFSGLVVASLSLEIRLICVRDIFILVDIHTSKPCIARTLTPRADLV